MRRLFVSIFLLIFVGVFGQSATALAETLPNDPYVEEWGYRDTGVYDAWDKATGSSDVVVAVIDDGFDSYHPDLADNVWKNIHEIPDNGIDDDHNGYIDDVYGWNFSVDDTNGDGAYQDSEQVGNNDPRPSVLDYTTTSSIENSAVDHGTLVAGIIGAVGNNGLDGAGINWHVRLMNLKVIGNSGNGVLLGLPRAIHYAVDNGADVINMSLVGSEDSDVAAAVKYAYDHGVAVIAAAGNDMISLNDIRRDPVCADAGTGEQWVLGVSAVGADHHIARFSNSGSDCVDIAAPGIGVSSTERFAPSFGLREEYGGGWQGTSFAAPFVSGAAALIKSIQPSWKAKDIYTALLSTTHKTPPKDEAEYADLFGAGLLQVQKAVEYALSKPRVIPTKRVFSSLLAAAPMNGSVVWKNFSGEPTLPPQAFKTVASASDLAVTTGDTGKPIVATLTYPSKTRLKITILNHLWAPVTSWTIPATGVWHVAVGNVTGSSTPEVVLSSGAPGMTLARVFSLSGKELASIKNPTKQSGVSALALAKTATGVNDIVVTYRSGVRQWLSRFAGGTWETVAHVALASNQSVLAVGAIDADADGVDDYLTLTRPGSVEGAFTSASGDTLSRFTLFDTPAPRAVSLAIGDYDGDGTDDFVVSPVGAPGPVRVWSTRVRVLDEWWPFGESALGGERVFALYAPTA